jgi:hypothetical protein
MNNFNVFIVFCKFFDNISCSVRRIIINNYYFTVYVISFIYAG